MKNELQWEKKHRFKIVYKLYFLYYTWFWIQNLLRSNFNLFHNYFYFISIIFTEELIRLEDLKQWIWMNINILLFFLLSVFIKKKKSTRLELGTSKNVLVLHIVFPLGEIRTSNLARILTWVCICFLFTFFPKHILGIFFS